MSVESLQMNNFELQDACFNKMKAETLQDAFESYYAVEYSKHGFKFLKFDPVVGDLAQSIPASTTEPNLLPAKLEEFISEIERFDPQTKQRRQPIMLCDFLDFYRSCRYRTALTGKPLAPNLPGSVRSDWTRPLRQPDADSIDSSPILVFLRLEVLQTLATMGCLSLTDLKSFLENIRDFITEDQALQTMKLVFSKAVPTDLFRQDLLGRLGSDPDVKQLWLDILHRLGWTEEMVSGQELTESMDTSFLTVDSTDYHAYLIARIRENGLPLINSSHLKSKLMDFLQHSKDLTSLASTYAESLYTSRTFYTDVIWQSFPQLHYTTYAERLVLAREIRNSPALETVVSQNHLRQMLTRLLLKSGSSAGVPQKYPLSELETTFRYASRQDQEFILRGLPFLVELHEDLVCHHVFSKVASLIKVSNLCSDLSRQFEVQLVLSRLRTCPLPSVKTAARNLRRFLETYLKMPPELVYGSAEDWSPEYLFLDACARADQILDAAESRALYTSFLKSSVRLNADVTAMRELIFSEKGSYRFKSAVLELHKQQYMSSLSMAEYLEEITSSSRLVHLGTLKPWLAAIRAAKSGRSRVLTIHEPAFVNLAMNAKLENLHQQIQDGWAVLRYLHARDTSPITLVLIQEVTQLVSQSYLQYSDDSTYEFLKSRQPLSAVIVEYFKQAESACAGAAADPGRVQQLFERAKAAEERLIYFEALLRTLDTSNGYQSQVSTSSELYREFEDFKLHFSGSLRNLEIEIPKFWTRISWIPDHNELMKEKFYEHFLNQIQRDSPTTQKLYRMAVERLRKILLIKDTRHFDSVWLPVLDEFLANRESELKIRQYVLNEDPVKIRYLRCLHRLLPHLQKIDQAIQDLQSHCYWAGGFDGMTKLLRDALAMYKSERSISLDLFGTTPLEKYSYLFVILQETQIVRAFSTVKKLFDRFGGNQGRDHLQKLQTEISRTTGSFLTKEVFDELCRFIAYLSPRQEDCAYVRERKMEGPLERKIDFSDFMNKLLGVSSENLLYYGQTRFLKQVILKGSTLIQISERIELRQISPELDRLLVAVGDLGLNFEFDMNSNSYLGAVKSKTDKLSHAKDLKEFQELYDWLSKLTIQGANYQHENDGTLDKQKSKLRKVVEQLENTETHSRLAGFRIYLPLVRLVSTIEGAMQQICCLLNQTIDLGVFSDLGAQIKQYYQKASPLDGYEYQYASGLAANTDCIFPNSKDAKLDLGLLSYDETGVPQNLHILKTLEALTAIVSQSRQHLEQNQFNSNHNHRLKGLHKLSCTGAFGGWRTSVERFLVGEAAVTSTSRLQTDQHAFTTSWVDAEFPWQGRTKDPPHQTPRKVRVCLVEPHQAFDVLLRRIAGDQDKAEFYPWCFFFATTESRADQVLKFILRAMQCPGDSCYYLDLTEACTDLIEDACLLAKKHQPKDGRLTVLLPTSSKRFVAPVPTEAVTSAQTSSSVHLIHSEWADVLDTDSLLKEAIRPQVFSGVQCRIVESEVAGIGKSHYIQQFAKNSGYLEVCAINLSGDITRSTNERIKLLQKYCQSGKDFLLHLKLDLRYMPLQARHTVDRLLFEICCLRCVEHGFEYVFPDRVKEVCLEIETTNTYSECQEVSFMKVLRTQKMQHHLVPRFQDKADFIRRLDVRCWTPTLLQKATELSQLWTRRTDIFEASAAFDLNREPVVAFGSDFTSQKTEPQLQLERNLVEFVLSIAEPAQSEGEDPTAKTERENKLLRCWNFASMSVWIVTLHHELSAFVKQSLKFAGKHDPSSVTALKKHIWECIVARSLQSNRNGEYTLQKMLDHTNAFAQLVHASKYGSKDELKEAIKNYEEIRESVDLGLLKRTFKTVDNQLYVFHVRGPQDKEMEMNPPVQVFSSFIEMEPSPSAVTEIDTSQPHEELFSSCSSFITDSSQAFSSLVTEMESSQADRIERLVSLESICDHISPDISVDLERWRAKKSATLTKESSTEVSSAFEFIQLQNMRDSGLLKRLEIETYLQLGLSLLLDPVSSEKFDNGLTNSEMKFDFKFIRLNLADCSEAQLCDKIKQACEIAHSVPESKVLFMISKLEGQPLQGLLSEWISDRTAGFHPEIADLQLPENLVFIFLSSSSISAPVDNNRHLLAQKPRINDSLLPFTYCLNPFEVPNPVKESTALAWTRNTILERSLKPTESPDCDVAFHEEFSKHRLYDSLLELIDEHNSKQESFTGPMVVMTYTSVQKMHQICREAETNTRKFEFEVGTDLFARALNDPANLFTTWIGDQQKVLVVSFEDETSWFFANTLLCILESHTKVPVQKILIVMHRSSTSTDTLNSECIRKIRPDRKLVIDDVAQSGYQGAFDILQAKIDQILDLKIPLLSPDCVSKSTKNQTYLKRLLEKSLKGILGKQNLHLDRTQTAENLAEMLAVQRAGYFKTTIIASVAERTGYVGSVSASASELFKLVLTTADTESLRDGCYYSCNSDIFDKCLRNLTSHFEAATDEVLAVLSESNTLQLLSKVTLLLPTEVVKVLDEVFPTDADENWTPSACWSQTGKIGAFLPDLRAKLATLCLDWEKHVWLSLSERQVATIETRIAAIDTIVCTLLQDSQNSFGAVPDWLSALLETFPGELGISLGSYLLCDSLIAYCPTTIQRREQVQRLALHFAQKYCGEILKLGPELLTPLSLAILMLCLQTLFGDELEGLYLHLNTLPADSMEFKISEKLDFLCQYRRLPDPTSDLEGLVFQNNYFDEEQKLRQTSDLRLSIRLQTKHQSARAQTSAASQGRSRSILQLEMLLAIVEWKNQLVSDSKAYHAARIAFPEMIKNQSEDKLLLSCLKFLEKLLSQQHSFEEVKPLYDSWMGACCFTANHQNCSMFASTLISALCKRAAGETIRTHTSQAIVALSKILKANIEDQNLFQDMSLAMISKISSNRAATKAHKLWILRELEYHLVNSQYYLIEETPHVDAKSKLILEVDLKTLCSMMETQEGFKLMRKEQIYCLKRIKQILKFLVKSCCNDRPETKAVLENFIAADLAENAHLVKQQCAKLLYQLLHDHAALDATESSGDSDILRRAGFSNLANKKLKSLLSDDEALTWWRMILGPSEEPNHQRLQAIFHDETRTFSPEETLSKKLLEGKHLISAGQKLLPAIRDVAKRLGERYSGYFMRSECLDFFITEYNSEASPINKTLKDALDLPMPDKGTVGELMPSIEKLKRLYEENLEGVITSLEAKSKHLSKDDPRVHLKQSRFLRGFCGTPETASLVQYLFPNTTGITKPHFSLVWLEWLVQSLLETQNSVVTQLALDPRNSSWHCWKFGSVSFLDSEDLDFIDINFDLESELIDACYCTYEEVLGKHQSVLRFDGDLLYKYWSNSLLSRALRISVAHNMNFKPEEFTLESFRDIYTALADKKYLPQNTDLERLPSQLSDWEECFANPACNILGFLRRVLVVVGETIKEQPDLCYLVKDKPKYFSHKEGQLLQDLKAGQLKLFLKAWRIRDYEKIYSKLFSQNAFADRYTNQQSGPQRRQEFDQRLPEETLENLSKIYDELKYFWCIVIDENKADNPSLYLPELGQTVESLAEREGCIDLVQSIRNSFNIDEKTTFLQMMRANEGLRFLIKDKQWINATQQKV